MRSERRVRSGTDTEGDPLRCTGGRGGGCRRVQGVERRTPATNTTQSTEWHAGCMHACLLAGMAGGSGKETGGDNWRGCGGQRRAPAQAHPPLQHPPPPTSALPACARGRRSRSRGLGGCGPAAGKKERAINKRGQVRPMAGSLLRGAGSPTSTSWVTWSKGLVMLTTSALPESWLELTCGRGGGCGGGGSWVEIFTDSGVVWAGLLL